MTEGPRVPHTTSTRTDAALDPLPGGAAGERAILSALFPGAGQLAQGRRGAAVLQAATVAGYAAGALAGGGGQALWLALAWNAWSVVDAFRYERSQRALRSV